MTLNPLRLATDGFFVAKGENTLNSATLNAITGAVWDELLSSHTIAGTTGAKLNAVSTLTVGDIPAGLTAQQVWQYPTRTLTTASGLTPEQAIVLQNILNQLEADYFKGDDRFIRYLKGTNTVILDKDVSFDPDQGYTITEHN